MTQKVREGTVDEYIKGLDPSKTLLLEGDVARLKKSLTKVFSTMQSGDCSALDEAESLVLERARDGEKLAKEDVDATFKRDENVELMLDPDKRGYARTEEDRKALVKKMIHFQMANYLISETKLEEAKKSLIHRYELIVKRIQERKANNLTERFAEAFAETLDPHSAYLSKQNLDDFNLQLRLSLEGIGASLSSQDGFTVIEELISGGGAEKSGMLRPKDRIIAVAQDRQKPVNVIDMDLQNVVKMIRGKKGTKVTLTVLRQGEKSETFEVTIVRDKIDLKDQAAKITYENREVEGRKLKIGVIDLPSFYPGEKGARNSYRDMKNLLLEAKKNNVDGIVLNLARNGGGSLEDAVRISGLFINKGGVVATKERGRDPNVLADDEEDTVYNGPLVVLTSRLSASASEILAGALRDYKRALVVGADHTFGKGTVQILQGLPLDLGAMKVTTGMFFLPRGKSTQHAGVDSDITIPSIFNTEKIGEKSMTNSLPPQAIQPFLSTDANSAEMPNYWRPVNPTIVPKLTELSRARVKKDPKFAEIEKEAKEYEADRGVVKLADLMKKANGEKSKKKKDDKDKKRGEKAKDLEAPVVQEAVNILADMIAIKL